MKKDKVKSTLVQLTAESKVKIRLDGEKDTMERRLREFIHLHNAQIGSEAPLTLESVIKAVNDGETQLEKESHKSARSVNKLDKVRNGEVSGAINRLDDGFHTLHSVLYSIVGGARR